MIDGFLIHHLTQELNQELNKSRLEKIIQQDEQSFILQCYHQGKRKSLLIDISSERFRMHLTEKPISNQVSSHFVMMLKKQLEGSILENVTQHQTDRVIIIDFTSYDLIEGPVKKSLVFEAMGKHSNLILVKDGIIIDTFKKMFFESGRQLLPQATFSFFPTDKKIFNDIDYHTISSPKDLVEHYMGISPMLSKYLFEKKCQVSDIKINPTRDFTKKQFYVFDIFDAQDDKKHYLSLSQMFDDEIQKDLPIYLSEKQFIDKQLKKLASKKVQLENQLEHTEQLMLRKNLGDLIYQSGIDVSSRQSHFTYDDQLYELDPTKTLNEHAQDAYKSYQKAKRGIHHIEEQIKSTEDLIEHFQSLSFFITVTSMDSIKDVDQELIPYGYKKAKTKVTQKKKDKINILTIKDVDATYMIGKNNIQNEYLTHTLAKKDDFFFHVKEAPGSHVIVQTSQLTEPVLRKACMLAAHFSTLKNSSSIPVDYTKVKHLKKIPGIPGYKVIYHTYQTMYIDIDTDKVNLYLKNV
jgi:predicted ribosome quality control (RQC) complex YloA/Tae2 family protein